MRDDLRWIFKLGTLKVRLIIAGVLILTAFLTLFMIGLFQGLVSDSDDEAEEGTIIESGDSELNEKVEGYRDDVKQAAKKYDIEDQVDVLLALMMQESGGKGDDPFQASESKCGSIGCITDVKESIDQGVKYYKQQLEDADGDIKLTLQSYNFGGGFIDYALDENDGYSKDVAVKFSSEKYEELKHTGNFSCINPEYEGEGACYGDVEYVDHVLQYYQPETADVITSIAPEESEEDSVGGNGKWGKPIKGDPEITSPYGNREDPIKGSGGEFHKGIDFACSGGITPIQSVDDGKVVYSQFNDGGYGNLVIVKHGEVYSHYAHMSELEVDKGDKIKKGDKVGVCGGTGQVTGPHLHLEAKKPKENLFSGHMNPEKMLK